ncbi:MAG: NAD-binding protein, partial [Candidatus Latescibacteria bacterium]|nr:NAD-binding protein [Candidatus Latescibacterota bacterium]
AAIGLKAAVTTGVMMAVGSPYRIATLTGLSLAQAGEFSLLLLSAALGISLVDRDMYQFVLAVCLFTMAVAPFIVNGAHRLADLGARAPLPIKVREGRYFVSGDTEERMHDHIVIVGYGVIGAMVGHSAKLCDIPYQVIEVSYDIVQEQRARGVPIFFGDATQEASLVKANVKQARVCVVAIPDPTGAARVVSLARRLNPGVHIVARIRYVRDIARLYALGANEVVSEETEASIKIFSVVLEKFDVDPDVIEGFGGVPQRR